jgi:hypothetical protein
MKTLSSLVVLLCMSFGVFGQETTIASPVRVTPQFAIQLQQGTTNTTTSADFTVPQQTLITDANIDTGELIIVKVSPPGNVAYLAGISYRWKVFVDGVEKRNLGEWPDGTQVQFGSGTRGGAKINVILSASYLYVVKTGDGTNERIVTIGQRSQIISTIITVNGSAPGPNPPPPGPNPPTPGPGKFGLATKVQQAVTATVQAGQNRAVAAQALANSFRGMSSAISAGTITDVRTLLTQTKQSNNTALDNAHVNRTEWDGFFTQLQQQILYPLYNANTISTLTDFKDAWQEIADGLAGVR